MSYFLRSGPCHFRLGDEIAAVNQWPGALALRPFIGYCAVNHSGKR